MRDYFIRRFLLIIPTLLGLTLLVFAMTRFVPGGPLDQAMMRMRQANLEGGSRDMGMSGRMELSEDQMKEMRRSLNLDDPWAIGYAKWLAKAVRGDFGLSLRYTEPVWNLIKERLPVSTYFGLMTLFVTYGICIPLGVIKALKHRTLLDTSTSVLVFAGYAVPHFALAALLVVYCAVKWGWFPTGGFTGENFDDLSLMGKVGDILHHTTLPLICYLIGAFAFLTMLKKNSLLDNLAADFVRTAVAKGCTFSQAVWRHALRNSFIPIATSLGHSLVLFLTGSFLIEVIFDIDGIGLLGYTSLLDRDYTVVMGVLTLTGLLTLVGNILSDFFVALTDPRVRFD